MPEFDRGTLIGQERRAALETAATTFGGWFDDVATIDVAVGSTNANTGTLATAGSLFPSTGAAGFGNRVVTSSKILGLGGHECFAAGRETVREFLL